jgi:hypothetical protein
MGFSYTGGVQSFDVAEGCAGNYKLEVWGAQGGSIRSYTGGRGAYAVGNIAVNSDTTLYITVGDTPSSNTDEGGYNGGGSISTGQKAYGAGGGGATDIRLNGTTLNDRIIVAAGGGGACDRGEEYGSGNGGYGGALTGGTGSSEKFSNGYGHGYGIGGSQNDGGEFVWVAGTHIGEIGGGSNGLLGLGGGVNAGNYNGLIQVGGGGGYYGGGSANHGGGGGGSSYTSTSLKSTNLYAGNTSFISPGGAAETGHTGSGYARITLLTLEN